MMRLRRFESPRDRNNQRSPSQRGPHDGLDRLHRENRRLGTPWGTPIRTRDPVVRGKAIASDSAQLMKNTRASSSLSQQF